MKVHFAHKSLRRFALLSMFLILFGTLATMASNLNGDLNSFFNLAYSSILSPFGAKAGNPAPVLSSPSAVLTATIATDRADYAPGQTVLITGTGFSPGETVRLQIVHITPPGDALKGALQANSALMADHQGHDPWNVVADANGNVTSSWLVQEDSINQTLLLTADGLTSGNHAETTFTDAIGFNKGVYNKDDFQPDSTGDWTTGNAGTHYQEGQWVYYQYQVAGVETTAPDFDVKFNHFQQNVNAIFIDAFANFRACVDCAEDSFTSGPKKGMLLDDVPYPSTSTANWKNALPAISAINGTLDSNGVCVATEDPLNTPSQEHCFKVDGSDLQALFPAGTFSTGVHTITLFYEAHLSNTRTWRNGNEYLIGCPTSVHWANPGPEVVPAETVFGTQAYSGGDPCLQDNAGDWTGAIQGVGFATGSSRHFNIINQTAGSQGQLSLPIPTVEAPTGSITIVKVTEPTPAAGAVFGFTGDLGPFNLDTDPTATNPSSITFEDIPADVPFNVTEASMPADWSLTNIVCSVTTGGVTNTNLGTATATVTLPSTADASATCTFTNTNINLINGRIIVIKETTPDNDPQSFLFTPSYNSGATFNLTDGQSNDSCGAGNPNCLPQGIYSVVETVPADWVQTSATCDDGSPVSAIDVGQGETVTCTFRNTKQTASITVTKTANIDEVCTGSNTLVTYTYVVNNTGTAALTVNLVDDNGTPGTGDDFDADGGVGTLVAAGGSAQFQVQRNISSTVINTVTATGVSAGGQQAQATASETVTASACTIDVTKSADAESICSGSSTTYDFTVTNNSSTFTWTGTFSDNVIGAIGAQPLVLAPGQTATFNNVAGPVLTQNTTNTATATGAFGDPSATAASDNASDTVNVSNCTIDVTKSADAESICSGSSTTYDFTVTNNSSTFTWTGTFSDNVIGAIGAQPLVLAPGQTATFNNVAGPVLTQNTTNTATATGAFGDPSATAASDNASDTVNVSNCTIDVTKSADAESICSGSSTTYDFTVTNNSNTFTWTGTFSDDVIGAIGTQPLVLAPGQTATFNNVAGPVLTQNTTNTATATGAFGDPSATAASDNASDTVNVSNCTIDVTKSADAESICSGSSTTYDFTVTNNSNTYTWTGTFSDNVIGAIGTQPLVLAPGQTATFNNVAGPVLTQNTTNTATATGAFGDPSATAASDNASDTVNVAVCRLILRKEVLPETDNTSTFAFNSPVGSLFDGVSLADDGEEVRNVTSPGTYDVSETVPAGWDLIDRVCVDPNNNSTNTSTDVAGAGTGSATFNLQLGETITCTFTNRKRGQTTLLKLTNGVQDPSMVWNFTLNGPGVNATDSTPPASMDFGGVTLTPGETYTMCEVGLPPTWTVEWKVDTDGDGIADMIIPFVPNVNNSPIPAGGFYGGVYDPNYVAYPGQYVNDTRCVNFKVTPGQTLAFEINNSMPGGDPRTIGYWKNWNRCTGGGQVAAAEANGGPEAGWFLLDDLLQSPGYHLGPSLPGGLQLDGDDSNALLVKNNSPVYGPDCEAAVRILNKSDVVNSKKMASDGAYNMAAQLLAAMLNYSAGAETCPAASTAINGASTLLVSINFNGTGAYLKNGPLYNQANGFAQTLDQYNNGNLCP